VSKARDFEKESTRFYVFQQEISNQLEWQYVHPIRFGQLKECYRTGEGDNDIAHFYFEAQKYCSDPNLISLT